MDKDTMSDFKEKSFKSNKIRGREIALQFISITFGDIFWLVPKEKYLQGVGIVCLTKLQQSL